MFSISTFYGWLEKNGYSIESDDITVMGVQYLVAEKMFGDRKIRVIVGENGSAKIHKPNGTVKWYYEKTTFQLTAIIDKIMEFYK